MMRHSILYLLLHFLYEMMHHDFSLHNYKLSNDLNSNVVIHECFLFITLNIFLKILKYYYFFVRGVSSSYLDLGFSKIWWIRILVT
jgi:hypothetical protein